MVNAITGATKRIDAIRYMPKSSACWHGRVPHDGITRYAIEIDESSVANLRTLGGEHLTNTARRYPGTWCVIHPLAHAVP